MSSACVSFSSARTLSTTASEVMTNSAEVPGVTRAWAYANHLGLGTVGVFFVMDDKVGTIIPSGGEVADVQAYIDERLIALTNQRAAARRRAGHGPGPEGSISKLMASEHVQRLQNLGLDLEGLSGTAWLADDKWHENTAWAFLRVRSRTIAGGTSEIQRNVLGERVLGLPKEPGNERNTPFSQLPKNA